MCWLPWDFATKVYKILIKIFFFHKIWFLRYFLLPKFGDRVVKFVWRVATCLSSFGRPKVRHTLSHFTIRKISLFWYDFVKESSPNSSYRSPKRRNEVGTQNFVSNLRSQNRTSKIVRFNVNCRNSEVKVWFSDVWFVRKRLISFVLIQMLVKKV